MDPKKVLWMIGGGVGIGVLLALVARASAAPRLPAPPQPTTGGTPPPSSSGTDTSAAVPLVGALQRYHVTDTSTLTDAQRADIEGVLEAQLAALGYVNAHLDPDAAIQSFLAAMNLPYGPVGASSGQRAAWIAEKVDAFFRQTMGFQPYQPS